MTALPFDLALATTWLGDRDPRLRRLIDTAPPFQLARAGARSPYEALLRSITYQSISKRAATTIFDRLKAVGGDGRLPTPAEMLRLRTPALRITC